MVSGGKGNTTGFEVHPHQLLPSVFEAPPEEYVIALHDYQPPSQSTIPPSTPSMGGTGKRNSTQTAHVCLAFLAGDRIRVLNRDVSGWWDGELMVLDEYLAEGDSEEDGGIGEEDQGDFRKVKVLRGWFPSNFVEDAGERIGMREVRIHLGLAYDPTELIPRCRFDFASNRCRSHIRMKTVLTISNTHQNPRLPSLTHPLLTPMPLQTTITSSPITHPPPPPPYPTLPPTTFPQTSLAVHPK